MRKLRVLLLLLVLMLTFTSTAYGISNYKSPYISKTYTQSELIDGLSIHNGIDVSQWQGSIDWTKVRNAGTEFAIIRCGYRTTGSGTLNKDPNYETYISNAISNGVPVGVYFFSQAISEKEAIAEAEYTLSLIEGKNITLPVIIDFEWGPDYRINTLKGTTSTKKQKATDVIMAFCETIEEAGYTPMVYANLSTMNTNLYPTQFTDAGYKLWIAQYNSSCSFVKVPYSAWQYTSDGTANGIAGRIDCNFWYGDDDYFKLTKPAKVIGMSQSAKSKDSITIKWTGNVDTTSYYVYRSDSYDGTYTKVATVTTNSYKDTGLQSDTNYYYRVSAHNSAGTGTKSSKLTAETMRKPGPVTGLSQTDKTKSSVKISWTKNSDAQTYSVYRSSSASGTYSLIKSGVTGTTYTDSGLSAEKTYYYKVSAVNDIGTGPQSEYFAAETLARPAKVTGLKQSSNTMNSISIKWTAAEDTDGYYVYRSDASSGTYSKVGTVTGTTYTDKELKAGTKYYYKVAAYNVVGTGTQSSALTAETVGKPAKVTDVTQSDKTKDTITIKWPAVEYASGYYIYRSDSLTGTYSKIGSTSSKSFKNTGLSSNKTYYYKVAAFNEVGAGIQSDAVKADTLYDCVKVTGVKRSARTVSSITIKWDAQDQAESYDVYRATAYDGEYVFKKNVTTNKYTNSGLTQGKMYYYKVVAKNALGEAEASAIYSGTIKPKIDRYGKVKNEGVFMYKRSGYGYEKVTELAMDDSVTIYALTKDKDGKTWYRAKYTDESGTVYSGYVKGTDLTITKKLTTVYGINLRKGAGTSYGKYGEVPAGKTRIVYDSKTVNGETWYQIKYTFNGTSRTGWVCGYYSGGANVKAKNL